MVVEAGGIGPTPYCGMLLADLGATVIRLHRPGTSGADMFDRGKHVVECDLKTETGNSLARRLLAVADIVIEGFRPGVMERFGLGPEETMADNPRLVYGRMTGWGQYGPRSATAGHDINYLALAGVLGAIGTAERSVPPLNLVADFGGGAMFLAVGVLAATIARASTGKGQVVDAAMVDGVAHLSSMFHVAITQGWWVDARESNLLDGAAPFYTTYRCADGGDVAVGALEPQFFASLIEGLGIEESFDQMDRGQWPRMRQTFARMFATRSRAEWADVFAGTDACVTPVNSLTEAVDDPHLRHRGTFSPDRLPAPAPRFEGESGSSLTRDEVLGRSGLVASEIPTLSDETGEVRPREEP